MKNKILLIDAYDSFVHIIYQYLLELDYEVDVIRNDVVDISTVIKNNYDILILGPGPGHPNVSGYIDLINSFKGKIPILGVCLGMQAIVLAFGGKVIKANNIMHGKVSFIDHNNKYCFKNLKNPLEVTRYHSLIAEEKSFPNDVLEIISKSTDDGYIMAINHKKYKILGVQFHPESITTKSGLDIFKNSLSYLISE